MSYYHINSWSEFIFLKFMNSFVLYFNQHSVSKHITFHRAVYIKTMDRAGEGANKMMGSSKQLREASSLDMFLIVLIINEASLKNFFM